jgi:hypothetical protein
MSENIFKLGVTLEHLTMFSVLQLLLTQQLLFYGDNLIMLLKMDNYLIILSLILGCHLF